MDVTFSWPSLLVLCCCSRRTALTRPCLLVREVWHSVLCRALSWGPKITGHTWGHFVPHQVAFEHEAESTCPIGDHFCKGAASCSMPTILEPTRAGLCRIRLRNLVQPVGVGPRISHDCSGIQRGHRTVLQAPPFFLRETAITSVSLEFRSAFSHPSAGMKQDDKTRLTF